MELIPKESFTSMVASLAGPIAIAVVVIALLVIAFRRSK